MKNLIENLPPILVTPERVFPPPTPHTYAHLGETATVATLYPDIPSAQLMFGELEQ